MYNKFKTVGLALTVGMFAFACNSETQNETNSEVDEAQVEMSEANSDMNREANSSYNDFETWVSTNTNNAETITEEEYRERRAEYKRREAEAEAESATWDDDTRTAWEKTKTEWKEFENGVQRRLGKIDDVDVDVNVKRDNN